MTAGGFVKLHRGDLADYCRRKHIAFADRGVFQHLILEADWRTGIVEGFTLTHCSRELGLGLSSGRRTLGTFLDRLQKLGVIAYTPSAGGLPGSVAITDYDALTRTERRAPNARRDARVPRGAGASRARTPRAGQPESTSSPAGSGSEEEKMKTKEEDARAASSSSVLDLSPEVEALTARLVEGARAAGVAAELDERSRRAVATLAADTPVAEIEAAMRFALVESDGWWPAKGWDLHRLLTRHFATIFEQYSNRQAAAAHPSSMGPAARPAPPLEARMRIIPQGVKGGVLQL